MIILLLALIPGLLSASSPRIAIVSLYDRNYIELGALSDSNKLAYAIMHGYDVHLFHTQIDTTRHPAYSKPQAILQILDGYDWIFWSDADALFMNKTIKLEQFLDERYDLIITKEPTTLATCLNTGNFFIKNSEHGRYILQAMIESKYPAPVFNEWDQGALMGLLVAEPAVRSWVKILPQRAFNSHPFFTNGRYQPGDFVIHFFGCAARAALMRAGFNGQQNFDEFYEASEWGKRRLELR